MLINPNTLQDNLEILEAIEKASLRLVVQAIYDFRESAKEIFEFESDLVADIGEDITREALDKLGYLKLSKGFLAKLIIKKQDIYFNQTLLLNKLFLLTQKPKR